MRIVWLTTAKRDRDAQIAYIADRSPAAAVRYRGRIDRQVRTLATHPFLGRPGVLEGTRELVITRTSYIVIYRVTAGSTIEIIRVVHGREDWRPRDPAD